MAAHEPSFMVKGDRFPRKSAGLRHHRFARNVWYAAFVCPECGERVTRLENPLRGKRLVCRGVPRKEVVRV